MNTTFFSHFKVNLEEQCQFWGPKKAASASASTSTGSAAEKEEPSCTHELPTVSSIFGSVASPGDGGVMGGAKKPKMACDIETSDGDGTESGPTSKGPFPFSRLVKGLVV